MRRIGIKLEYAIKYPVLGVLMGTTMPEPEDACGAYRQLKVGDAITLIEHLRRAELKSYDLMETFRGMTGTGYSIGSFLNEHSAHELKWEEFYMKVAHMAGLTHIWVETKAKTTNPWEHDLEEWHSSPRPDWEPRLMLPKVQNPITPFEEALNQVGEQELHIEKFTQMLGHHILCKEVSIDAYHEIGKMSDEAKWASANLYHILDTLYNQSLSIPGFDHTVIPGMYPRYFDAYPHTYALIIFDIFG